MAKFCTNCGTGLPEGVAFCPECGTKVPEAVEVKEENQQSVNVEEQKDTETALTEPAAPETATTEPAAPETVTTEPVAPETATTEPVAPEPVAPPPPPPAPQVQQTPPPPPVPPSHPPQSTPPQQPPAQPRAITAEAVKGTKYEPISTWGFIGILLLLCIPVVGLILAIVWACGGCRKQSKKSLARALLIIMAITLVIGLLLGLAGKWLFDSAIDVINTEISESGGILSGLLGGGGDENEQSGGLAGLLGGDENEQLGGLAGLLGGDNSDGNSDYGELGALGELFGALEALGGTEDSGDWGALFGEIEDINNEAEVQNDGWPESLRKYPGGTSEAVASYRTEISGTSAEEMHAWIEDLKRDGYVYTDFYDFGMSEADMLSSNGWWGTNGTYYISVSYYDGIVTVDHLTELPDYDF